MGVHNVHLCVSDSAPNSDIVTGNYAGSARVCGCLRWAIEIPDLEMRQHSKGSVNQVHGDQFTSKQEPDEALAQRVGLAGIDRIEHFLPQRWHTVVHHCVACLQYLGQRRRMTYDLARQDPDWMVE